MSNRNGTELKESTSSAQKSASGSENYKAQDRALSSAERKQKIDEFTDDPDYFYDLGKEYQATLLEEFKKTNIKPTKDNPNLSNAEYYFGMAEAKGRCALGLWYLHGNLVDKNAEQAVRYFAQATCWLNAEAAYYLAYCYEHGEGVQKTEKEAAETYQFAAKLGEPLAQKRLGDCYRTGQLGFTKDPAKADKYYLLAARGGNIAAMHQVVNTYIHRGKITPVLDVFESAAKLKYQPAQKSLYHYQRSRDRDYNALYNKYLKEQDYEKAYHYQFLAASQPGGNKKKLEDTGSAYFHGHNVAQDLKKAGKFWEVAYRHGELQNPRNKIRLAYCYEKGFGVTKNLEEAFVLYQYAAQQGDVKAKIHLANCYLNGRGVSKDESVAVQLFQQLANQNEREAQYHLGFCYFHGTGIVHSYQKAIEYFKLSAISGYKDGVQQLAACYQHGYGVDASQEMAELLLKSLEEKSSIDITTLLAESSPSVTIAKDSPSSFYYHSSTKKHLPPLVPTVQDVSAVPSSSPRGQT